MSPELLRELYNYLVDMLNMPQTEHSNAEQIQATSFGEEAAFNEVAAATPEERENSHNNYVFAMNTLATEEQSVDERRARILTAIQGAIMIAQEQMRTGECGDVRQEINALAWLYRAASGM